MSWSSTIQSWLPRPEDRSREEIARDVDDEFAFHLEMKARSLQAEEGLDREAARGVARERFGDVDRIKDECQRLALKERSMLQRVNFVLMLVVLVMVAIVGWNVMQTQSKTAMALQAITDNIAKMKQADDAERSINSGGFVYVEGDVPRPGTYSLPSVGKLTVRRALVAAGMPRDTRMLDVIVRQIDAQGRTFVRYENRAFNLDGRSEDDFVLTGDDHVVVTRAPAGMPPAVSTQAATQPADTGAFDLDAFVQRLMVASIPNSAASNLPTREELDQGEAAIANTYARDPTLLAKLNGMIATVRQRLDESSPLPKTAPAARDEEVPGRRDDDDYPRVSPFSAVLWNERTPMVNIDGTWGAVLAINDQPIEKIMEFCAATFGELDRKRFTEDLVMVLDRMDEPIVGDAVKVRLREARSGAELTIAQARLTEANRNRLWEANQRAARQDPGYPVWQGQPPPPPPTDSPPADSRSSRAPNADAALSPEAMAADIDALAAALRERWSYAGLRAVDIDALMAGLRESFANGAKTDEFALAINAVIARLGDGHAGVDNIEAYLPQRFTPFLVADAGGRLVAFTADRASLLDAGHPYLVSMQGLPIARWLELAGAHVADGSPALKRRRSISNLRWLGLLGAMAGVEIGDNVRIELASEDGGSITALELPVSAVRPTFGEWPRAGSSIIEGDIAYLRLPAMNADAARDIQRLLPQYAGTKGMIVDVRGNGGGSRDGLLALLPAVLAADAGPQVVNVAAYREHEEFGADHLEARFMYRRDHAHWSDDERAAIDRFAAAFTPRWSPPVGIEFSDWHYLVVSPPIDVRGRMRYVQPVVILMDGGCFSATDIFLGAFKGRSGVTLMGTASSGGSGRQQDVRLPNSGLTIALSSMISYQPDGSLYDGAGIEPDVVVQPGATDFIRGGGDAQLQAAIALLRGG